MKNSMLAISFAALAGLSLAGAAEAGSNAKAVKMAPKSCAALNAIDPDNDGAMTLLEAKRRALVVFAKMNPDGDRTLEPNEVQGRLSKAQFAAADSLRRDGKISRLEWLIAVKQTFRAANPDRDRSIECDELRKGAGKALFRMLK